MKKWVEISKRTKKEQKKAYSKHRVMAGFNTGTRTMKTEKSPTRSMNKKNFKKMLDNYYKECYD